MVKPIRVNFGYNKNIIAKSKGPYLNIYINDNVFKNGELIKKNKNRCG